MPMNIDRERLLEENLSLKNQLNKMQTAHMNRKKEISFLENEISQKDKIIENYINDSSIPYSKINEMQLVINIKKRYKDLKKDYEKSIKDLDDIKKNTKNSKINELISENQNLYNQIDRMKNLCENSLFQNQNLQGNIQDVNSMKNALSKQDFMIMNFQENNKKMIEAIQNLNIEIEKLKKQKNNKTEMINKLKQKLKYQHQINERLIMKRENIQSSDEYLTLKNKYEKKLQIIKKDLAYYKDSNSKKEKIIRELKQFQKEKNDLLSNTYPQNSNMIIVSNQQNNNENIDKEKEKNEKIFLLQSRFQEEKTERKRLEKEIENLKEKISTAKRPETKILLQNSPSSNLLITTIHVKDYEYMSNNKLNEFIYVLIKNFEANKIDMSIIESRIINKENLELIKDKNNYKKFISTISNGIIEILKIRQEKDQIDIHSFIKTFLYNNYISKNSTNPDDFKTKFLHLFTNISFYSIEQKQELNKIIAIKMFPIKDKFIELLKIFDEDNKGYISFTSLKKIMEELELKLKKDVLEYFIYTMKVIQEEGTYLYDLKYSNLIKILEETTFDPNENIDYIDGNEKEDDDAIEITNEEYLNKVKDIISRICKHLTLNKKNPDDVFLKIVSKSIIDYKAIRLVYLVELLKQEFKIDLSNIEIFCLFTKIKPGNSRDTDNDIDEIVDYTKLKKEIENCMKNQPKKDIRKSNQVQNKLNYSEKHDRATEKVKEKSAETFKIIILEFMKKHKFTFERFIFPVHCMMKLSTNGKVFNRFLEIQLFKHFLYQNGILVTASDVINYLNQDKLLLCGDLINIDYLKFLLAGRKGIRDNIINEFMSYKPIIQNEQKDSEEKKDNNLEKDFFGDDDFDAEL